MTDKEFSKMLGLKHVANNEAVGFDFNFDRDSFFDRFRPSPSPDTDDEEEEEYEPEPDYEEEEEEEDDYEPSPSPGHIDWRSEGVVNDVGN